MEFTEKDYQEIWNLIKEKILKVNWMEEYSGEIDDIIWDSLNKIAIKCWKLNNHQ